MTDFEKVDALLKGHILNFLTTEHPDLPVEWPNVDLVDIETSEEDFIDVAILYSNQDLAGIGTRETILYPEIWIYYNYKPNTGESNYIKFLNTVNDALTYKSKDAVDYLGLKTFPVTNHKGWESKMIQLSITVPGTV